MFLLTVYQDFFVISVIVKIFKTMLHPCYIFYVTQNVAMKVVRAYEVCSKVCELTLTTNQQGPRGDTAAKCNDKTLLHMTNFWHQLHLSQPLPGTQCAWRCTAFSLHTKLWRKLNRICTLCFAKKLSDIMLKQLIRF